MNSRIWAIIRRDEIIDTRTFLNRTRIVIIAEKLTKSEAESYLQGISRDLEIISQDELDTLKKRGIAYYE